MRELAIELGVASVYLEDEIALLENYHLITRQPNGKYQTNLLIFTEEFTNEFHRTAEKSVVPALGGILRTLKEKLPQIRQINGICQKLSDERLMWNLLWPVILWGKDVFSQKHPEYSADTLYSGATGTNYGSTKDGPDECYRIHSFAGYAGIDENYYASAADFGILPENNRFFSAVEKKTFCEKIYRTVSGEIYPEFMIISKTEESTLKEILAPVISMIGDVYETMFSCAGGIMRVHAPKSVEEQIERILFQTMIFQTAGFWGFCAVKSGELDLPTYDGPAAVIVRENQEAPMKGLSGNVLLSK